MMRVLVADKVVDEALELLKKEVEVDIEFGIEREKLLEVIENYDALIVRSLPLVDEAVLRRGRKLKVVGRAGNGIDNIDVKAATCCGIVVVNTPDSNSISAAEQTIALMLASARKLPEAHTTIKNGGWGRSKFLGAELFGKTVGIVGLGRIGSLVATRLRAFGMKVIAYDPYITLNRFKRFGAERMETLNDLVKEADFITVHTPKTEETIGMIGEEQFVLAKPGVRVLNCARGGIVQEEALYKALVSGKVASAGLDVFEQEPVPSDNPLISLPNVVMTPHLGATTVEAQHRVGTDVAKQVLNVLKGKIVNNAVNLPGFNAEELEGLAPYLKLAEYLGKLYFQLEKEPVERVELSYNGELAVKETDMIKISFLKGLLTPILGDQINYVNTLWLAENRGIKVYESKEEKTGTGYTELLMAKVAGAKSELRLAGTITGNKEPRIVQVNDYQTDISPTEYMLFVDHYDKPGVIGPFATLLGASQINIAMMQVGRKVKGDIALMTLNVDSAVDKETLGKLEKSNGIVEIKLVHL